MERKPNLKESSPTIVAALGALITLIGGFFLSYNYIESKKIMAYDYVANVFYTSAEKEVKEEPEETEIIEEEKTEQPIEEQELEGEITNDYIGYLTIPKINLTKGFLDKRSTENDVEKNILVVEGSNYPDTERGNLILAGHSGTGWKAFFNDLYKLEKNDQAIITYKNKKYIYNIVNIYTQPKDKYNKKRKQKQNFFSCVEIF